MKKIFYEKVGRRYIPVREYDSEFMDATPKGSHLVMTYPGGKSCRYNIDPNYAAMIAAGRIAENAIANSIVEASKIRLQRSDRERQLTPGQKAAWENLIKEFGNGAKQLEWASAREIAEIGVQAMHEEAMKLMKNDTVKNAYAHFVLVSHLTKDNVNEKS